MLQVPKPAVELVKRHEGLRLDAYLCPANVCTIGYGHTGPDVKLGDRITKAEADKLLRADLRWATDLVDTAIRVHLSEPRRSALISWVFNIGETQFKSSTLLRKLNAGDYDAVPAQLARWNKAKGKVLPGLVTRRAEEAALWLSGADEGPGEVSMPQAVDAPEGKPLSSSVTIQGAGIAGIGTAGTVIADASEQLRPIAEYSHTIRIIFCLLAVLGIAMAIWGRIRVQRDEGV